jgi:hypothetical protein
MYTVDDEGVSSKPTNAPAITRISLQPPNLVTRVSDTDQLLLHGRTRPQINSKKSKKQQIRPSNDPLWNLEAPAVACAPVSHDPLVQQHTSRSKVSNAVDNTSNVKQKKECESSSNTPLQSSKADSDKRKDARSHKQLSSPEPEEATGSGTSRATIPRKRQDMGASGEKKASICKKADNVLPGQHCDTSQSNAVPHTSMTSPISPFEVRFADSFKLASPNPLTGNPAAEPVRQSELSSSQETEAEVDTPGGFTRRLSRGQVAKQPALNASAPDVKAANISTPFQAVEQARLNDTGTKQELTAPVCSSQPASGYAGDGTASPEVESAERKPPKRISRRVSVNAPDVGVTSSKPQAATPQSEQPEVGPFRIPLPMIEVVRYFRPVVKKHLLHTVLKLPCDTPHLEHTPILSMGNLATNQLVDLPVSPEDLATQAFVNLPHKGAAKRHSSSLRRRIHLAASDPSSSLLAKLLSLLIMLAILASTIAYCYESMPDVPSSLAERRALVNIERVTTIIFTVEYVLRLLTCDNVYRFVFSLLNVVDVFAILPFYIELILRALAGCALPLYVSSMF